MTVKPTTIFLATVAALLGLLVYAELQGTGNQTDSDGEGQPLFSFAEDDVESLTIQTDAATVRFNTDDEGNWQLVEPVLAPANDASVAYLLSLLTTAESDRTLTVPTSDLATFGLNLPLATVDIELTNQASHRLILGDYDFNRSFLYAQTDPASEGNTGEISVLLVSPNFENAVNLTVDEWQQPPDNAETDPSGVSENEAESGTEEILSPELDPVPSP